MNFPRRVQTGHELGQRGEEVAAAYLERRGFQVLEKRFRTQGGEIDLVCLDASTRDDRYEGDIVFVEVKARSSRAFGAPESSISSAKRLRLHRTGHVFLHKRRLTDRQARIDVVTIVFEGGVVKSVEHYPDAIGLHEVGDRDERCEAPG